MLDTVDPWSTLLLLAVSPACTQLPTSAADLWRYLHHLLLSPEPLYKCCNISRPQQTLTIYTAPTITSSGGREASNLKSLLLARMRFLLYPLQAQHKGARKSLELRKLTNPVAQE